MYIKIIGFISAILTTTSFLPQAVKTWKTRSTEDLSPIMFILFFFGIAGWLIYGILIADLPMILANSVTICLAGIILYFILKNNFVRRIHHIALYTEDIEKMKSFYTNNFQAKSGKLYYNSKTNFSSYFITFNSGCKLELMNQPERTGHNSYDHISISVGHKSEVDKITDNLKKNGFEIHNGPRVTGDGYYESTFLDPEGNKIEITI
jgi:lactoylglutathione lyase